MIDLARSIMHAAHVMTCVLLAAGLSSSLLSIWLHACLRPCVHASSIPLLDGVAVRELIQGPNLAA